MKKLMILAVAAIALVACSKTFDVGTSSREGRAIGFSTWAEHLTKTVTPNDQRKQGKSTFVVGDSFAVYGLKIAGTDSTLVLNNVPVVCTDASTNPTTWDYNDHVFWDGGANQYDFYAASPSSLTANTGFEQKKNGALTTGSLTFDGNNNDILIANKVSVEKGNTAPYFNSYGTVAMVFNHAASLIDVKVKRAPTLTDTVYVSALALNNVKTAGALSLSKNDYSNTGEPAIDTTKWVSSATGSYRPENGVNPVYGHDNTNPIAASNTIGIVRDPAFTENSASTPSGSTALIDSLVVMPQAFVAHELAITYTIGTDTTHYSRVIPIAAFDTVDNVDNENDPKASTGWEPAKHYIYYITIDAKAIGFTASITDWTEVNGYQYLIN